MKPAPTYVRVKLRQVRLRPLRPLLAAPSPHALIPYGLLMPCGNPRCHFIHAIVGFA